LYGFLEQAHNATRARAIKKEYLIFIANLKERKVLKK
jgi:hypothetical protein